jgi:septal ring factor EnvC (AmiA/AmiB activator)
MRYFISLAVGLAVVALIALVFPLLQTQELVQERGASAELEKVVANLKTELNTANKGGAQLKAKLDEASANIEQLRNELAAAKSQSTESQAHAQELTTELEKARRDADQQRAAERQASQSQVDALNVAYDLMGYTMSLGLYRCRC